MGENNDWIAPLIGFVGLLAGTLFFSNQNNSSSSNNSLPPPPVGTKSSGCGCQAKKT